MTESDDDFLTRWSRRKKEARQGLQRVEPTDAPDADDRTDTVALVEGQDPAADGDAVVAGDPPAGEAGEGDEKPKQLTEDDFADVDFDALNYESDYTRFMQDGVPDAIRRRALKQLYRSNPILANLDGLNDYDDDFTDAALAVEVLQTAYKVGRGYLTDEDLAEMEDDDAEGDADGLDTDFADAEDIPDEEDSESDETSAQTAMAETADNEDDEAGGDAEPERA